jgi:endonuclease G
MNGGTWVDLEERVRYWSRQTTAYDTLFVVTGAILPRSPEPYSYIYDTDGNRSVVPGHLYKALLRKSKTTGNYSSIAFIMENAATGISYSDDKSVTSVQQLESETGFTFFPNLPEEVAETVKQNSALSPHWK